MLGTKSVVNARGAALDAARYYGLRRASSSERRAYSASRRLHPSPSLNTSINTWPRAVTETRGGQYTATYGCSTCSAPREVQRSNPEASRVVSGSERNEKKTKRGASAPSPSSLAPARGQW